MTLEFRIDTPQSEFIALYEVQRDAASGRRDDRYIGRMTIEEAQALHKQLERQITTAQETARANKVTRLNKLREKYAQQTTALRDLSTEIETLSKEVGQ